MQKRLIDLMSNFFYRPTTLRTLASLVLISFSFLFILPPGMFGVHYAFARNRPDTEEIQTSSGAREAFPPVLLAAPGKFNPVLEAHGFDTQMGENYPLGLALAMVFLEAAKRGLEDEELKSLAEDMRIHASTVSSLANIAYEAQVNADVLIAENNPPDVAVLEKEFSDPGLREIILKDSQFTGDSLYLMAFVFILYGFSSDQVERILGSAGIDFEAFYSQLGVAQRFLEMAYMLPLPKNLGFRRADAVLPLAEEKTAAETESGAMSEKETPRAEWEVRENAVAENRDPSEEILDRIRKDMEKVNSRLITLNHSSRIDVEKAIRYLEKKTSKISAQLDQMTSAGVSPSVELRKQRVFEMLTGLENKKEELRSEAERLKAEGGAQEEEATGEGLSVEELLDAKDELLFKIQNTDKNNLDAVEGLTQYLENEIRNLQELASRSDVSTESVIRAITAELTSELKRLIGIKNALISGQVQGQTRSNAPASEEKASQLVESGKSEKPATVPPEKQKSPETEQESEEMKEIRRRVEVVLSDVRQKVSALDEQLSGVSAEDENALEENIRNVDSMIQEIQRQWELIPGGFGEAIETQKGEIQKYLGILRQRGDDLKETLGALREVREEEYASAEKTVEQINMTFEGLCGELETVPQNSAALDAKIEEIVSLNNEFSKKAEDLLNSTRDIRIEGFQKRIQSMVQNLDMRREELELKRKELLEKAAAEKAAAEKAEAERIAKQAEAERQAAAEKAAAEKAAAERAEAERIAKQAEAERQAAAEKAAAEKAAAE
ncbi:MAG TPA: hypothetical protein PKL97_01280, partial [Candidatus Omnitrophota bacterium]|nr:hypothetical protein [Candidatus Omnitrophota bacterium]